MLNNYSRKASEHYPILNNKGVYIIIPAYNEESNIQDTIQNIKPYADNIVIVDDGSTDNTFGLAEETGVIVLKHILNRGQGAALQTGNEYAVKNNADIVVHFDADGQFAADDIAGLIKPIEDGTADIVFGSRFLGVKSDIPKFKEFIIFPIARFINRIFFNIKLTDPQSGLRAMSGALAKKIIITNDGGAHCSEILYQAYKNNYKISEIPITVKYNDFGQKIFSGRGRGTGGLRILRDLIIYKLLK